MSTSRYVSFFKAASIPLLLILLNALLLFKLWNSGPDYDPHAYATRVLEALFSLPKERIKPGIYRAKDLLGDSFDQYDATVALGYAEFMSPKNRAAPGIAVRVNAKNLTLFVLSNFGKARVADLNVNISSYAETPLAAHFSTDKSFQVLALPRAGYTPSPGEEKDNEARRMEAVAEEVVRRRTLREEAERKELSADDATLERRIAELHQQISGREKAISFEVEKYETALRLRASKAEEYLLTKLKREIARRKGQREELAPPAK